MGFEDFEGETREDFFEDFLELFASREELSVEVSEGYVEDVSITDEITAMTREELIAATRAVFEVENMCEHMECILLLDGLEYPDLLLYCLMVQMKHELEEKQLGIQAQLDTPEAFVKKLSDSDEEAYLFYAIYNLERTDTRGLKKVLRYIRSKGFEFSRAYAYIWENYCVLVLRFTGEAGCIIQLEISLECESCEAAEAFEAEIAEKLSKLTEKYGGDTDERF